jgi:hypothetical protein
VELCAPFGEEGSVEAAERVPTVLVVDDDEVLLRVLSRAG